MSISFFYKKGSAGYVRGEQPADYLGCKKNPVSGFEDDICVYVKHFPEETIPKRTYIDIDDSPEALEWVRVHPEVRSIATTEEMKEFLTKEFNIQNISVIPHAHCNYERWLRPDREIKTVGTIGSKTSFQYPVEEFKARLKEIGLELNYEQDYWNTYVSTPDMPGRLKVVNFYKTLDIQIIWRHKLRVSRLKNPNKLANAGSFGIPTIANPAPYLGKDWDGNYIQTNTIDEMIEEIRKLKDNYNFNRWHILTYGKPIYFHKPRHGNGCMIATRELVIEGMERRIEKCPELSGFFTRELGSDKRTEQFDPVEAKSFYTNEAIVSLTHEFSTDKKAKLHQKYVWPVRAYDIPFWGKAEDIIKEFV